jgi:hypothetical protein
MAKTWITVAEAERDQLPFVDQVDDRTRARKIR